MTGEVAPACRVTLDEACRRIRRARPGVVILLRVRVTAPRAVHTGQPDWSHAADPYHDEADLRGYVRLSRPAAIEALHDLYVDVASGRQVPALVELHEFENALFVN